MSSGLLKMWFAQNRLFACLSTSKLSRCVNDGVYVLHRKKATVGFLKAILVVVK